MHLDRREVSSRYVLILVKVLEDFRTAPPCSSGIVVLQVVFEYLLVIISTS